MSIDGHLMGMQTGAGNDHSPFARHSCTLKKKFSKFDSAMRIIKKTFCSPPLTIAELETKFTGKIAPATNIIAIAYHKLVYGSNWSRTPNRF
jgi:hypothetical protein